MYLVARGGQVFTTQMYLNLNSESTHLCMKLVRLGLFAVSAVR